jgi:hypothetical protein
MENHSTPPERLKIVGATCLKVADIFAEQSKEYYKQENISEYSEAMLHEATPAQLLECEKSILPRLNFDLWVPTAHWFLQVFLAYARFAPRSPVGRTALFIDDLALLDGELLRYRPSLRAQCALVLAAFVRLSRPSVSAPSTKTASPRKEWGRSCAQLPAPSAPPAPRLEAWESVRDQVCRDNTPVEAEMCLQRVTHVFVVRRREWKTADLTAVEAKHADLTRSLTYPEAVPLRGLVGLLLPSSRPA